MERICFLLKVRSDRIDEYKKCHANVWPEMLTALRETGWRNYSLFLRDDGLLVGYLETDDFANSLARMKDYPVNEAWQNQMAPLFETSGRGQPDDRMRQLEEVFHLH